MTEGEEEEDDPNQAVNMPEYRIVESHEDADSNDNGAEEGKGSYQKQAACDVAFQPFYLVAPFVLAKMEADMPVDKDGCHESKGGMKLGECFTQATDCMHGNSSD